MFRHGLWCVARNCLENILSERYSSLHRLCNSAQHFCKFTGKNTLWLLLCFSFKPSAGRVSTSWALLSVVRSCKFKKRNKQTNKIVLRENYNKTKSMQKRTWNQICSSQKNVKSYFCNRVLFTHHKLYPVCTPPYCNCRHGSLQLNRSSPFSNTSRGFLFKWAGDTAPEVEVWALKVNMLCTCSSSIPPSISHAVYFCQRVSSLSQLSSGKG